MKFIHLISLSILFFPFNVEAQNFKAGDIQKATISNGFKVNKFINGFPILINFGWDYNTNKKNSAKNKTQKCILIANANADFKKRKSYLYVDRIECENKNIEISAYITDTQLDFGIKSKLLIKSNSLKYLTVERGTRIYVVFKKVEDNKMHISDSNL